MASQVWVSGAVHVFVAFPGADGGGGGAAKSFANGVHGGNDGPMYLGTGEKAPYWRVVPGYAPVFSDLGGHVYPFDVIYSGIEGFVTVRLTRWNYATLQQVEALSGIALPGTDGIDSVGTLPMLENKIGMHVYLTYPYSSTTFDQRPRAFSAMSGQPKGVHFYLAEVEDLAHQPGTGQNSCDITWHCRRSYDAGSGTFTVYDNNVGGLPDPE